MEISADIALLDVLRAVVRFRAREAGFPADEAEGLALAITETAANVIRQRQGSGWDGRLALQLKTFADRLELVLEDLPPKLGAASIRPPWLENSGPEGDARHLDCGADVWSRERGTGGQEYLRVVKYLHGKVRHEGERLKLGAQGR